MTTKAEETKTKTKEGMTDEEIRKLASAHTSTDAATLIVLYNDGKTALVRWPGSMAYRNDYVKARVYSYDLTRDGWMHHDVTVWDNEKSGPLTKVKLEYMVDSLGLDRQHIRERPKVEKKVKAEPQPPFETTIPEFGGSVIWEAIDAHPNFKQPGDDRIMLIRTADGGSGIVVEVNDDNGNNHGRAEFVLNGGSIAARIFTTNDHHTPSVSVVVNRHFSEHRQTRMRKAIRERRKKEAEGGT